MKNTMLFATLISITFVGMSRLEAEDNGVVYFLPKSIVTVTVRQYRDLNTGRRWYTLGDPTRGDRRLLSRTIPDPAHRYVIKYDTIEAGDKNLCISREPVGLLRDVQFAVDDQNPEIVVKIDRIVRQSIDSDPTIPMSIKIEPQSSHSGNAKHTSVREWTSQFDPLCDSELREVQQGLRKFYDDNVRLDLTRMHALLKTLNSNNSRNCTLENSCLPDTATARCNSRNICYRVSVLLPIDLQFNGTRIDTRYADIVNTHDIGSISIDRAIQLEKLTKLAFSDGALSYVTIMTPRETLKAAKLPLTIYDAILTTGLSAPGQFLGEIAVGLSKDEVPAKLQVQQDLVAERMKIKNVLEKLQTDGVLEQTTSQTDAATFQTNCNVSKKGPSHSADSPQWRK